MEKSEHNELLDEVLADLRKSAYKPEEDGEKLPLFGIGSLMDQWSS